MSETPRARLPFEVWALVAGGLAVALGYGVVAPTIPQFALEFGVSNFAASAIVSAFALMRVVGAPLAGTLVDRFGERTVYSAGILIVAVSTGATAFAGSYAQFLVLRGAGGIGSAMFSISATGLLAKVSPPNARGRVSSLNAAGFLLGNLLGPVLGGVVTVFGIRAPFVFYFFTLLIAAAIVTIALRGSELARGRSRASTGDARVGSARETADGALGLTLRSAIRIPRFRSLLLSVFAFGWSSFGVRVSVIPIFVATVFHGDPAMAAWVLAGYAAGNAVMIFPAGRWIDSVGRTPMLIIGCAILTLAYACFPASPTVWIAIGIMVVAGVGSALVNPAQQAVLADVLDRRRGGNVVAAYSMSSDLGGVIGPLVAGFIVDLAGFGWAFGVTAALIAVALVGWLAPALGRPQPSR